MKHFEIEHRFGGRMRGFIRWQIRIWRFLFVTDHAWPVYWIVDNYGIPSRDLRARTLRRFPF